MFYQIFHSPKVKRCAIIIISMVYIIGVYTWCIYIVAPRVAQKKRKLENIRKVSKHHSMIQVCYAKLGHFEKHFLKAKKKGSGGKDFGAFFRTIPHSNPENNHTSPPPLPLLSMAPTSIWDSFVAQASLFLHCQYAATLSRGRGLTYLCKVDHSRTCRNFSRSINSVCEILSQSLRKLGK